MSDEHPALEHWRHIMHVISPSLMIAHGSLGAWQFDVVTCGSAIKIQHVTTGYRIHSVRLSVMCPRACSAV